MILEISIVDKHRLSKSLTAAGKLIAKLGPNDRIGIVTTDQRLRLPLTLDKQLAQSILSQLSSRTDTDESLIGNNDNADFGTLLAVLNEMFSDADGERIVICQCDGSQASWLKRDGSFRVLSRASLEASGAWRYSTNRDELFSEYSYADLSQSAIFSGVAIYPIVPGIRFVGFDEKERLRRSRLVWSSLGEAQKWRDYQVALQNLYVRMESETLGQEMLKAIADLSGGNMGFIEKPEDADRVYDELFQILDGRYLIGYYPKNEGKPGERRPIKVEVKGRPDLTVHGRTKYIVS